MITFVRFVRAVVSGADRPEKTRLVVSVRTAVPVAVVHTPEFPVQMNRAGFLRRGVARSIQRAREQIFRFGRLDARLDFRPVEQILRTSFAVRRNFVDVTRLTLQKLQKDLLRVQMLHAELLFVAETFVRSVHAAELVLAIAIGDERKRKIDDRR